MTEPSSAAGDAPTLVRALGAWDCTLLTIGNVVGSAVFIAANIVPANVPHAGWVIAVWIAGGLLSLAGALTYAELGTMFPRAGGPYQFLKEAYGPLFGFLYGWTCFLVILCGAVAYLAVASAEMLGRYVPAFLRAHEVFSLQLAGAALSVNGNQLGATLLIVVLTAINYVGLRPGVFIQNVSTVAKFAALVALIVLGFLATPLESPNWTAPLASAHLLSGLGVAMIAVFWAYDGWYCLTYCGAEIRDPERSLPRGLLAGTATVMALYVLLNLVYLRALPLKALGEAGGIADASAGALLGSIGAPLVSAGILASVLGALAVNVLGNARVYLPMAQDGLFFSALARIHPTYRTPSACLVAQACWSIVLACTGRYDQIGTYVTFAVFLFHAAIGAAIFVLRRQRPDAPRPYRTWGYPWTPAIFVLTSLVFVASTFFERPLESLLGLGLVALGLPVYAWWSRRRARERLALP